uniref:C2H2-type domain-containing protein n=1 Tax=Neogobius melanostomus TaxID=47308 RepID=A0A8C6TVN7_9GOBI
MLLPVTAVSRNDSEGQDLKEENQEPHVTSVSGNSDGNEQGIKEENSEPYITSVSGNNDGSPQDIMEENSVTKEEDDSYDCEFCGEKFARRPRLGKHIMAKHLDELLVKCPECDMQFANKRALASHQKFHTGKKIFLCKSCGAAFKYISNYVSHMNDHMGVQPYECGECGRGFSTKRFCEHVEESPEFISKLSIYKSGVCFARWII